MEDNSDIASEISFEFFDDIEALFDTAEASTSDHKENKSGPGDGASRRFKEISEQEIANLITSAQAINTKYSTNWATKAFKGVLKTEDIKFYTFTLHSTTLREYVLLLLPSK